MNAPEHFWAYCDSCEDTCPVNGSELREYLIGGEPHSYIDLICSICYNIIAAISIGPTDGSLPVERPLHLPPPEPSPAPAKRGTRLRDTPGTGN